jgi:ubiquinone/menaquinone biosynthesis C-methylase UbiE
MKIHVGCGNDLRPDYINVDTGCVSSYKHDEDAKFVFGSVLELHRLFMANSADEIYARYLFEHLSPSEVIQALYRCWQVLKPQGTLTIIVPCIKSIVNYYIKEKRYESFYNLELMGIDLLNYDGQETPHKSVWSEEIGRKYLEFEGLYSGIVCAGGCDPRGVGIMFGAKAIK